MVSPLSIPPIRSREEIAALVVERDDTHTQQLRLETEVAERIVERDRAMQERDEALTHLQHAKSETIEPGNR